MPCQLLLLSVCIYKSFCCIFTALTIFPPPPQSAEERKYISQWLKHLGLPGEMSNISLHFLLVVIIILVEWYSWVSFYDDMLRYLSSSEGSWVFPIHLLCRDWGVVDLSQSCPQVCGSSLILTTADASFALTSDSSGRSSSMWFRLPLLWWLLPPSRVLLPAFRPPKCPWHVTTQNLEAADTLYHNIPQNGKEEPEDKASPSNC